MVLSLTTQSERFVIHTHRTFDRILNQRKMFVIMTKDTIFDKFMKKPENHFAFTGYLMSIMMIIMKTYLFHWNEITSWVFSVVITNNDFHEYFYCRKLFSLSNINCTICIMTQIPAYHISLLNVIAVIIGLAFAFIVSNCWVPATRNTFLCLMATYLTI